LEDALWQGTRKGNFRFAQSALALVHYGAMSLTEGYLKPECEILEYDKARWHIKVRWLNPEHTGYDISEANSQGDFENILICMDLE
jgi:hypothetical protein